MGLFKKITIGLFAFFANISIAQTKEQCAIKFNLFRTNITSNKFVEAKPQLLDLIKTCPKLTVNIYKYGAQLAIASKDAELMKTVYEARKVHFPLKEIGEAHNQYTSFMYNNKLGTEEELFELLKVTYKYPKVMSVKNIYRYFKAVYSRNKETNPSFIFTTYDDIIDKMELNEEESSKQLKDLLLKEEKGTLTDDDKQNLEYYKYSSEYLGKVARYMESQVNKIAKCDDLVVMMKKEYEANKTNIKWLKRSVKRLNGKSCKGGSFYETLVKDYADVAKTPNACIYYAIYLEGKGDKVQAEVMRKKAFQLETDPYKKAKMKLTQAINATKRGQKSRARVLAREAIKFNRNLGKAYLLIAGLYKSSVNSCGKNEFERRMVYVAALNQALRAKAVDPSCGASRYIKKYKKQVPSTALLFKSNIQPGSKHKIGCWINETVTVPTY